MVATVERPSDGESDRKVEVSQRPMPDEHDVTHATGYFALLTQVLQRLPYRVVDDIAAVILDAYRENRAVYLFGNGGSAALASHSACDLGKGTVVNGNRRFRVLALTDNIPLLTAWANDARYDDIFAEQLQNFVQPGDIAFAISGSGNSPNVLNALRVAGEARAFRIGLTGFEGGKMKALCDLCLVIPSDNMQIIEDAHLCVAHAVFTAVRHNIARQFTTASTAAGVPR
jgi:D-sedoheptulose 7-phosphate isomerase